MSEVKPPSVLRVISESDVQEVTRDATREVIKTELLDKTKRMVTDVVRGLFASPAFAQNIRDLVRGAALEVVREIIAEDMPDLEERVRKIVAENWEKSVTAAAHATLDTHLAAIRRKLGL
jgi:hypothetical protein